MPDPAFKNNYKLWSQTEKMKKKGKPQCVLCDKEIPEDQMVCDECWEKDKKNWKGWKEFGTKKCNDK